MKRVFKIVVWSIAVIVVLMGIFIAGFIYKIKNGFPVSYETEVPAIDFPEGKTAVLLFSKATGFRHGESIEAGKSAFGDLANKNNWFLYSTEEGGAFNPGQLAKFDVVVFNNSTGRVLNDEQQKALEEYVEQGGSLIGIHGSGDNSHHWDWYVQNLVGAEFSHHSLHYPFQETTITLNAVPDSLLSSGLPFAWTHADEWYVFLENPRAKGFSILYAIDGETIDPTAKIPLLSDKDFGMGKDHPVAWYHNVGQGSAFYTSLGHDATAWKQEVFVKMLENAVNARR